MEDCQMNIMALTTRVKQENMCAMKPSAGDIIDRRSQAIGQAVAESARPMYANKE
jgi:hypothetical protein